MPDGSVLLVEIARETLTRVTPDGRAEIVARIPGGPNGAAVGPDGRIYVCNNGGFAWIRGEGTLRNAGPAKDWTGGSIEVVDPGTGRVERLYESCNGIRFDGPNDLVFDGEGGFWFTDPGKRQARDMDLGFVYWARADGTEIREVIAGLITPNGIGPHRTAQPLRGGDRDGPSVDLGHRRAGHAAQARMAGTGRRDARRGGGGQVRFDSLAVTEAGSICVAALDTRAIAEIAPDSGRVRFHPVPDMLVTNLCFGGPDRLTTYVTLSHERRLAVIDWHEPGLRLQHQ